MQQFIKLNCHQFKPCLMKRHFLIFFFAASCMVLTYCNKNDENPSKSISDLPANAQTFLQNCSEGCKTYVQLVNLGGVNFFYLGINAVTCTPDPNRTQYLLLDGTPVDVGSELDTQLKQNGILVNEIYNCDDL